MLLSGLPDTFAGFSDMFGQRLAAYSCGGSSGFGSRRTGFPLSSGPNEPGEPRRVQLRSTATSVNHGCDRRFDRSPHRDPLVIPFGARCHSDIDYPSQFRSRNDGLNDRSVQRLVLVKPDGRVKLGAGLHLIDHVVSAAVTLDGGEQVLLRLVGNAQ